jgi:hypothetical protein
MALPTRSRPLPPDVDHDIPARIRALEAELTAAREALLVQFLTAIAPVDVVRHGAFSASALWDDVVQDGSLDVRRAFAHLGITSARRLGKRLRAASGRPLGPWFLERQGMTAEGVQWRLRTVIS